MDDNDSEHHHLHIDDCLLEDGGFDLCQLCIDGESPANAVPVDELVGAEPDPEDSLATAASEAVAMEEAESGGDYSAEACGKNRG